MPILPPYIRLAIETIGDFVQSDPNQYGPVLQYLGQLQSSTTFSDRSGSHLYNSDLLSPHNEPNVAVDHSDHDITSSVESWADIDSPVTMISDWNPAIFQTPTELINDINPDDYVNVSKWEMGSTVYVYPGDYPSPHADGHECLYTNQLDHQGFNDSTSGTAFLSPVASNTPQGVGAVLQRQRKQQTRREKRRIICQFQGDKCEFMIAKDNRVFKNLAELKEDALRHLNPYQCEICGKRFGKRYGKERHSDKRKFRCVQVKEGRNDKSVVWVSRELEAAVSELEEAREYNSVMAAINKCKELSYFTDETRWSPHKKLPLRIQHPTGQDNKSERHFSSEDGGMGNFWASTTTSFLS